MTRLTFVRRQHEAENATTFCFQPRIPLKYRAGQYLRYTRQLAGSSPALP